MLQELRSQAATARLKAAVWQTQFMFERLPQEAGAARPRGMHFCYSRDLFSCHLISALGMDSAYSAGGPIGEIGRVTGRVCRHDCDRREGDHQEGGDGRHHFGFYINIVN